MTRKLVGKVTVDEKNEIHQLFKRKNSLKELSLVLTQKDSLLYEKLVSDLGDTLYEYEQWWSRISKKYNWESTFGSKWNINFETCEIFLVTE